MVDTISVPLGNLLEMPIQVAAPKRHQRNPSQVQQDPSPTLSQQSSDRLQSDNAERQIATVENAIIGGIITARALASTDEFDLLKQLPKCVQQVEDVINMLRPCKSQPAISAYERLYGEPYDFDKHPMLPLGLPVMVWDQPKTGTVASSESKGKGRTSWGGYIIGSRKDAYRSYSILMQEKLPYSLTATRWVMEDE